MMKKKKNGKIDTLKWSFSMLPIQNKNFFSLLNVYDSFSFLSRLDEEKTVVIHNYHYCHRVVLLYSYLFSSVITRENP